MAWVAFDRAVKIGEDSGFSRPENLERWREIRDRIHAQVCERGFQRKEAGVHAGLWFRATRCELAHDAAGRVSARERSAGDEHGGSDRARADGGRVRPALSHRAQSGWPAGRRRRVSCSALSGWRIACTSSAARRRRGNYSSACSRLRNDVGLLAEEYDPKAKRMLGNFPQAFSHIALVNTARILSGRRAEAEIDKTRPPPRRSHAPICSTLVVDRGRASFRRLRGVEVEWFVDWAVGRRCCASRSRSAACSSRRRRKFGATSG